MVYSIKLINDDNSSNTISAHQNNSNKFKEFNVLQRIRINECKENIREIIGELKMSKRLVLQARDIFMRYLQEKLKLNDKEENDNIIDKEEKAKSNICIQYFFFYILCHKSSFIHK